MAGKIVKKLPFEPLEPRLYRKHVCSTKCMIWTFDENECKGLNPLVVPLKFGFKRTVKRNGVTYTAPCGLLLNSYECLLQYLTDTKHPIAIDCFSFSKIIDIYDEFVVPQEFIVMKDLSYGKEEFPLQVVNTEDLNIPPYMDYTMCPKPFTKTHLNFDKEFLCGCDCTDNCADKTKCACWRLTAENIDASNTIEETGYKFKRIDAVCQSGIYECNSNCKCSKDCLNRVVQLPPKVKLQLFKTEKKGWGTRCVNDIPKGTFVCLINGLLMTNEEANMDGSKFGDEYVSKLDFIEIMEKKKPHYEENPPAECMMEVGACGVASEEKKWDLRQRKAKEPKTEKPVVAKKDKKKVKSLKSYFGAKEYVYTLNSTTAGNIGRYFNHSCQPNAFVQNAFVDSHDPRFPWIALFTNDNIKAGTELTWDYSYKLISHKKKPCYCGTANCRGRLM